MVIRIVNKDSNPYEAAISQLVASCLTAIKSHTPYIKYTLANHDGDISSAFTDDYLRVEHYLRVTSVVRRLKGRLRCDSRPASCDPLVANATSKSIDKERNEPHVPPHSVLSDVSAPSGRASSLDESLVIDDPAPIAKGHSPRLSAGPSTCDSAEATAFHVYASFVALIRAQRSSTLGQRNHCWVTCQMFKYCRTRGLVTGAVAESVRQLD